MKMLLQLAWRNIWRHPARSGVLLAAIIAGLWAGITMAGLMNGFVDQRIVNLVEEQLTHVQIHHPEFLTEREPGMYIRETDTITRVLNSNGNIRSWTARTLADGMIQSAVTTSGVQIRGVDPETERTTTTFHRHITEGEYLDSEIRNPVLIGHALADRMKIQTGDRVVLTFQDVSNEITSASFTVSGIFRSGNTPYDERTVFVRASDLSILMAGNGIWHEVAILLSDVEQSTEVSATLNAALVSAVAETWYELSPELRYMTGMSQYMTFFIMIIILLALVFGILNTMLMAIFERMRELGMVMAIGMSRSRVFSMIISEAVILTLTGAAAGMILAWYSVRYLGEHGVDLTMFSDALAEFGYQPIIYPYINGGDFVLVTILVMVTAIISSIYPAIKALRLNPAQVVRE
jgi:ABC-type lipoprotein release transport system permease subunit